MSIEKLGQHRSDPPQHPPTHVCPLNLNTLAETGDISLRTYCFAQSHLVTSGGHYTTRETGPANRCSALTQILIAPGSGTIGWTARTSPGISPASPATAIAFATTLATATQPAPARL